MFISKLFTHVIFFSVMIMFWVNISCLRDYKKLISFKYTVTLSQSAAIAYLWFDVVTLLHIFHEILIVL